MSGRDLLSRARHQGAAIFILFAWAILYVVTPGVWAQVTDDDRDEVVRLFGAQWQATEAIKKLGGKVEYEAGDPAKRVVAVDLSHSKIADSEMDAL